MMVGPDIQVRPNGLLFGSPLSRNSTVVVKPLLVTVVDAPLVINAVQRFESAATVRRGKGMVNTLTGATLVTPAEKLVALYTEIRMTLVAPRVFVFSSSPPAYTPKR